MTTDIEIELKTSWTEEDTDFPMIAVMEITLGQNLVQSLRKTMMAKPSSVIEQMITDQIKNDIDLSIGQDYIIDPKICIPDPVSLSLQLQSVQIHLRARTLEDFTVLKLKYYG